MVFHTNRLIYIKPFFFFYVFSNSFPNFSHPFTCPGLIRILKGGGFVVGNQKVIESNTTSNSPNFYSESTDLCYVVWLLVLEVCGIVCVACQEE